MSKTNKKQSVSTFQDEGFSNEKHSKWIGKPPTPAEVLYLVCKKNFDISLMEVSALASHAYGKKRHPKLLGKNCSMDIRMLLGASNKSKKSETSDK